MQVRAYGAADLAACQRVWQECGWHEIDTLADMIAEGQGVVAEFDGSAECLALAHGGTLRYLETDLSLAAVTGVTTGLVARRRGAARATTARLLAEAAAAGQQVAMLGIFDQGFYNRLGFGNGAYVRQWRIDPGALRVPVTARPPVRLDLATHAAEILALRLRRRRGHGAVNLPSLARFRNEVAWRPRSFGLGYRDGADGALSHGLWLFPGKGEHGPATVSWLAWQTGDQLLELLALLAGLADQYYGLSLEEPADLQLLDLLDQPFRRARLQGDRFPHQTGFGTPWQARILDLPGCLAATRLPGPPLNFNLDLADPLTDAPTPDSPWRGCGGPWRVRLGEESTAEPGHDPDLPTLTASVGAFSRLWLGVRPARALTLSDALSGPPDLLAALDRTLAPIPTPQPDWEF